MSPTAPTPTPESKSFLLLQCPRCKGEVESYESMTQLALFALAHPLYQCPHCGKTSGVFDQVPDESQRGPDSSPQGYQVDTAKLKGRHSKMTKEQAYIIQTMHKAGHSRVDVAQVVGLSEAMMYFHFERGGRPKSQRAKQLLSERSSGDPCNEKGQTHRNRGGEPRNL